MQISNCSYRDFFTKNSKPIAAVIVITSLALAALSCLSWSQNWGTLPTAISMATADLGVFTGAFLFVALGGCSPKTKKIKPNPLPAAPDEQPPKDVENRGSAKSWESDSSPSGVRFTSSEEELEPAMPEGESFSQLEDLAATRNADYNRFLEEIKKHYVLPLKKDPLRLPAMQAYHFTISFENFMESFLKGTVVLNYGEIKLQTELLSLIDLEEALIFFEEQIKTYNENFKGYLEPLKIETFAVYKAAKKYLEIWKRCACLNEKSAPLSNEELHELQSYLEELPSLTLNNENLIEPHIFHLVHSILNKPSKGNPQIDNFIKKLTEGLQTVLSTEELTPSNALAVVAYAKKEIDWMESALKLPKSHINYDGLFESLILSWNLVKEFASDEASFDRKMELLDEIAHKLPENDSPIYKDFPKIREEIGEGLKSLIDGTAFSKIFTVTDRSSYTKLQESFQIITERLGCEAAPLPEFEMDTENDARLAAALQEEMNLEFFG